MKRWLVVMTAVLCFLGLLSWSCHIDTLRIKENVILERCPDDMEYNGAKVWFLPFTRGTLYYTVPSGEKTGYYILKPTQGMFGKKGSISDAIELIKKANDVESVDIEQITYSVYKVTLIHKQTLRGS